MSDLFRDPRVARAREGLSAALNRARGLLASLGTQPALSRAARWIGAGFRDLPTTLSTIRDGVLVVGAFVALTAILAVASGVGQLIAQIASAMGGGF